jgi:hypothetical protein
MPRIIRWFLVCYRALIHLYPHSLRRDYGGEMVDVLEQQLRAQWESRAIWALIETCLCAIGELTTIAIPSQLLSERLIAPCLSLVITSAMYVTLISIIEDKALAKWIDHTFLFAGRCR